MHTDARAARPLLGRAAWARLDRVGQVHVVVASVSLLAILATLLSLRVALEGPQIEQWQFLTLVAILPLSELALLHVRFGGDSVSFTWGESCVLVGFSMVAPWWLVVLAGPCVTVVHLLKGRGLMKSAYNGAAFALSAAVAAEIIRLIGTAPYTVSDSREAGALVVAVVVFSFTSLTLTSLVVAVAQGESPLRIMRANARMVALVAFGNLATGGAFLFLAERSRSTLLGLPPLLLAVFFVYRGYLRASQERDVWRLLETASRDLNHLEESEVVRAALRHGGALLRANKVDLVLQGTATRPARMYELDHEDLTCIELDAVATLLHGRSTLGAQQVLAGSRGDMATVLLSPLEGPSAPIGTLRLHFSGPVSLSARERQVLATFTHAVATTLLNVALHEGVREDARRQAHHATHDPLTGLANRLLLRERTTMALNGTDPAALLLIDLDHFKEINDTLGHAAGDVLLQRVADRLLAAVPSSGLVARLGGDEFAILLTDLTSAAEAGHVAERLIVELGQPVDYQGLHLSVEGSIGLAMYPQDAENAEELFRRADVAMYQAKADRGSWLRYDSLHDDSSIERLALVADLRTALDRDELIVHYQQQQDLETGLIVGAEALVRWQHPVRGLLQPAAFVGIAEQSGLVRPFTLRVLELAVAECASWQSPNGRPLSVAVNLGARSLLDRRLPDDVAAVLRRHGLAPDRLVLEITETTAASELEIVEDVLGRLRRLGVEISVDDFGTGYSSLSFLQRTAVHELKVDRSFVSGMLDSDNDLALVRATVQLAHSLGARAVAEGVESAALLLALRSLGCDAAQGYHLSRPVPAADFRRQVAAAAEAAAGVPAPRAEGDRHLSAVTSA